ncbi:MAG: FAD:protein FMN transferase [Planctomycetes bacterium]|nr:FAD:protein FMN transferase [Planctomycetota bacterium]
MILTSCSSNLQRFEYRALRMGSEARIVMYASEESQAAAAASVGFLRMAELEQCLSDWRLDSEVVTMREAGPGSWIAISPMLENALQISLDLHRRTEGAFDPLCGRMTARWREARASGVPPNDFSSVVGTHGTGVDRMTLSGLEVRFEKPVPWLDFGGIGKGLAADLALSQISEAGISRAIVELGGDMALGAPPPGQRGWRIRVGEGRLAKVRMLAECGAATSGPGYQHIATEGSFASHILDPRTGQWVGRHSNVTVIAQSAAEADALASAGCVLGAAKLRQLLASAEGGADVPIVITCP